MIKPNCSPQMWYNLHFTLIIFYPDLYLHIISFLRDLRDTNNNSKCVVSPLQYLVLILLGEGEPPPRHLPHCGVLGAGAGLACSGHFPVPGQGQPAQHVGELPSLQVQVGHSESLGLLSHHRSFQFQSVSLLPSGHRPNFQSLAQFSVQIKDSLVESKNPEEDEALETVSDNETKYDDLETLKLLLK